MGRVVGPLEHVRLLGAVVPVAGLEHADLSAGQSQNVRGDSASRAGADNDHVICFGGWFYLGHLVRLIISLRDYPALLICLSEASR